MDRPPPPPRGGRPDQRGQHAVPPAHPRNPQSRPNRHRPCVGMYSWIRPLGGRGTPGRTETMKNLLLAGYLGAGNLGDDAVMLGLVHGLGGAGYSVTVLSGAPEETHRLYGFPSV